MGRVYIYVCVSQFTHTHTQRQGNVRTAVRREEAAVARLDDRAEGHALEGEEEAVVGGEAQLGEALFLEAEEAGRGARLVVAPQEEDAGRVGHLLCACVRICVDIWMIYSRGLVGLVDGGGGFGGGRRTDLEGEEVEHDLAGVFAWDDQVIYG